MMARSGYKAIVVYLDDFLVIGALAECFEIFSSLLKSLQSLGFSVNWKKVVPSTQCLIFLGVLIDTVSHSMSLPHDKLVALHELSLSFRHRHRASKRQLQGLAGKLNWTCRVVYGGCTFLRRILDTMSSMRSASVRCLLECGSHEDLNWWVQFLAVFNGRQLLLDSTLVVDVQTDACFEAAGAYFYDDWVYLNFGMESPELSDLHINHKEALAVVVAAERWASINKGSTRNSFVMNWLRRLFWLSAIYNFRITARYIEGADNVIADAILRMHIRIELFIKSIQFYSQL